MTLQVFNLKKTSRKHKTNFLHLKDTDQTSQTGQSQRHKTNFSNISKTRNKHLKHLKLCNKGISRVLHDETDFLKCCNASKGHWSHTYCLHFTVITISIWMSVCEIQRNATTSKPTIHYDVAHGHTKHSHDKLYLSLVSAPTIRSVYQNDCCILNLCACYPCSLLDRLSYLLRLLPGSYIARLIFSMLVSARAVGAIQQIDCRISALCACHPCSLPEFSPAMLWW